MPSKFPAASAIKLPLGFMPTLDLKLAMVASMLAEMVLLPKLSVTPTLQVPLLDTVVVATWVLPFQMPILAPGVPVPARV